MERNPSLALRCNINLCRGSDQEGGYFSFRDMAVCCSHFFCYISQCARGPLQKIVIVITSSGSTAFFPGLNVCTKLSKKLASKIIGADRELHTKEFIRTSLEAGCKARWMVPTSFRGHMFVSRMSGMCSCFVRWLKAA